MEDREKLKKVLIALKKKFTNLSAIECLELGYEILDATKDEASLSFQDQTFGSFKVSGGRVDIDNLQKMINSNKDK